MKRQIDPNLSNQGEEELLLNLGEEKDAFGFNDYTEPKPEPVFTVNDKIEVAKISGTPITTMSAEALSNQDGTSGSGEHHHHSSDGSSHHHSSGSSSHHHSSGSSSHHHSSGSSSHHHSSGSSSHHHSSSSSSHHHSSSKKKKMPLPARIALGVLIVLLLLIVIAVGTFFVMRYLGHKQFQSTVTANTPYQETIEYNGHTYRFNDDVIALGFMGIDQRQLETAEQTDFVGAADADLVAAIDTKTGVTKVIAIPRDTMVDIDIFTDSGILLRTQQAQLCLAYAYGDGGVKSCESTVAAMSRVLYNVPINRYYALDLDGIKPLNDAIGGVTVTSLYDFTDYGIKKGDTVTLHGDMAEWYVRLRSMDDVEASLNRTERQVQYVKAYANQVLPAVIKDFSVVSNLYSVASDYSATNLTLSNTTYLASQLLSKGVRSFDTFTIEGEMKGSVEDPFVPGIIHAEFYPDEDSVMQIVLDAFYTQID